MRCTHKFIRNP